MSALAHIEFEPAPVVRPHCIFAAGRKSFDVIVLKLTDAQEAKLMIFNALPLKANGWDFRRTSISLIGEPLDGNVWRVRRHPPTAES